MPFNTVPELDEWVRGRLTKIQKDNYEVNNQASNVTVFAALVIGLLTMAVRSWPVVPSSIERIAAMFFFVWLSCRVRNKLQRDTKLQVFEQFNHIFEKIEEVSRAGGILSNEQLCARCITIESVLRQHIAATTTDRLSKTYAQMAYDNATNHTFRTRFRDMLDRPLNMEVEEPCYDWATLYTKKVAQIERQFHHPIEPNPALPALLM